MIVTVIGGSASGKSAYAEKRLSDTGAGTAKYYIATMKNESYNEERIRKHVLGRAGKAFITIEEPENLKRVMDSLLYNDDSGEKACLIEDMSNLLANIIFDVDGGMTECDVNDIIKDIKSLSDVFKEVIIVTNDIFGDGIDYPDSTKYYLEQLGLLNQMLAGISDTVIRTVLGIPLVIK